MEGILIVLLVIDVVLTCVKKLNVNVNINYPQPELETYSNLEELQKAADEEYEKEQQEFVDTAQAVQDLFLDKEAE